MLLHSSYLLSVLLAAGHVHGTQGSNAHNAHNGAQNMPSNHPPLPEHMRPFVANLRCPYASEWLTKGPERAAHDLAKRRSLGESARSEPTTGRAAAGVPVVDMNEQPIKGSCTYTNAWTQSGACVEFRGWAWTPDTMSARCSRDDLTDGTFEISTACELPPMETMAGWCVTYGNQDHPDSKMTMEVSPMTMMGGGMDCAAIGSACTTFAGGDAFVPGGACDVADASSASSGGGDDAGTMGGGGGGGFDWTQAAGGGTDSPSASGGSDGKPDDMTCRIAPGPIGAAHQMGQSYGYRSDCPDMPGESSPYQWPLRWTAVNEMKSMAFGSDDITYTAKGRVWYMLDRNWKRSDTYHQYGTVPFFARSTEDEDTIDSKVRTTMLHRGSKMYFISYHNGTADDDVTDIADIKDCRWLDMSVVGNIRPDWFMDDVGDSTDVQYLGNQHVYYDEAGPRLVKQWRKKDFASQYFTMSMQENTAEDDMHWPLVLNIPGEGFGDDMLQSYKNHENLSEDDTDIFLLDEAFVEAGGSCPQGMRVDGDGEGGGGAVGPPADFEKVPSNLEIDDNAWVSNVYTFSPVWEPPVAEEDDETLIPPGQLAVTKAGPSTSVATCYDSSMSSVELAITFDDLSVSEDDGSIPWLGLSFRETDECLMTPRGGGEADVALVMSDEFGALTPLHYAMSPTTKSFGMAVGGSTVGRAGGTTTGFSPLEDHDRFSDVRVTHSESGDSVTMRFKMAAAASTPPDVMHLTYAIGSRPEFGYHSTRACFDVSDFPPCPGASGSGGESSGGSEATTSSIGESDYFDASAAAAAEKHWLAAVGTFAFSLVTLTVAAL